MSKYLRLFLVVGLVIASSAIAQSPSPSTSSAVIRDAVKQQVDKELANIKQAVAKKAYVGSISNKADLTLTITNLNNQSRTATVTTDTAIKLAGGKDGTPADLKVGDFVIAMGDADSNGVLTTKRLLVVTKSAPDNRAAVFATVTKVTATTITAENLKKEAWTIKLNSSTSYTGTTSASDIKVGSKLVIAGASGASNTLSASIIQLLPVK